MYACRVWHAGHVCDVCHVRHVCRVCFMLAMYAMCVMSRASHYLRDFKKQFAKGTGELDLEYTG